MYSSRHRLDSLLNTPHSPANITPTLVALGCSSSMAASRIYIYIINCIQCSITCLGTQGAASAIHMTYKSPLSSLDTSCKPDWSHLFRSIDSQIRTTRLRFALTLSTFSAGGHSCAGCDMPGTGRWSMGVCHGEKRVVKDVCLTDVNTFC
jgi:hypothetical protein